MFNLLVTCLCFLVVQGDRFDCYPESGSSQSLCEARGCTWNETTSVDNEPYCYYPSNYGYFVFNQSIRNTSNGYNGILKQSESGPYGNDMTYVSFNLYEETTHRLRVTLNDNNKTNANKRYRVPIDLPNIPSNRPQRNNIYSIDIVDTSDNENLNDSDATPFGIRVIRESTQSTIFDSSMPGMILSDQFLQINFEFAENSRLYGWGERFSGLELPKNYTTVASFSHDVIDYLTYQNSYGVHPFILGIEPHGNAFGFFIVNSNAMEIVITPHPSIQYRTIGGILDFYIFLGPTPNDVILQYWDVIGTPFLPAYWSLGFHLCRWGYNTSNNTREIVESMIKNEIPYDTQWNDIDYMDNKKDFTYSSSNFSGLSQLVNDLHSKYNMHYVNIIDPAISNASGYSTFTDGLTNDVFIKSGDSGNNNNNDSEIVYGSVWPGITAFPDFWKNETIEWWSNEAINWKNKIDFDGWWIDMNEPSSFIAGSTKGCGNESIDTFDNPPYFPVSINSGTLYDKTICMSSKQEYNYNNSDDTSMTTTTTTEHYNVHSLYGYSETIATHVALNRAIPNERNFIISRSTYPGSGKYGGHWNGDNTSKFKHLQVSIPLMIAFNMFGIPLVGSDICGFIDDTTLELCSRWMQVGAFYPFSRNHNTYYTIAQDPPSLGEPVLSISRGILNTRYTLLPNLYTLFYHAHNGNSMVTYPLFFNWYFISETLGIETQFLWGKDMLLISPVLEENVTIVNALFPLFRYVNDTLYYERWYDYWSFNELTFNTESYNTNTGGYEYKSLYTPLDKINLHIRGGTILTLQNPNGALTTVTARYKPLQLLIALDSEYSAIGNVYFDDGITYDFGYNYIEYNVFDNSDANIADSVASVGDYLERTLLTSVEYNDDNGSSVGYKMENNGTIDEIRILGIGSADTNSTAKLLLDFVASVTVNSQMIEYNSTNNNQFAWYYNTSDVSLRIFNLSLNICETFEITWQLKSESSSSSGGTGDNSWFKDNVIWVIVIIVAVLFVLGIAAYMGFCWKKRSDEEYRLYNYQSHEEEDIL